MPNKKTAVIVGAGPAGLTAAQEILSSTDIELTVLEATNSLGGISRTVNYKGNRIDIGGHRFFSKSKLITEWWLKVLPLQGKPARDDLLLKRKVPCATDPLAPDPEVVDRVMLIRRRLSRIYFLRMFFDYPISLTLGTVWNLGAGRIVKIALSYIKSCFFPVVPERSLKDFFINRFGAELYQTFFKDYTEKVWGVPCDEIKPEWGAQRVKGLSISKAIAHALSSLWCRTRRKSSQQTETSLIEEFYYPKFGPGQLWETVAENILAAGADLKCAHKVIGISLDDNRIKEVLVLKVETGEKLSLPLDYLLSSMPVKDLIEAMGEVVPQQVKTIAEGLCYRDFITVGLLVRKLRIKNQTKIATLNQLIPDTWIYIQEREVKLGRLQIFNNWSPYMVKDPDTVWLGLEYFCSKGDELWSMEDSTFSRFAVEELARIGFIEPEDILDTVVIRVPKAYPAYFGSFAEFDTVRAWLDRIPNLFLIGRNGMHRYNNQDHSMLSAIAAVQNIAQGVVEKTNIWQVNAEKDYHEEEDSSKRP